jgi:hypothetical protein
VKISLFGLGFLLLLPVVQATCVLEVPDAVGDASPSGLPPYYDLGSVRLEWSAGMLNWSWNASGMKEASEVFYFGGFIVAPIDAETGQPHKDTGAPHFHPECDRHFDATTVGTTTTCLLTSSPNNEEGGGAVLFSFVSYLNWTEQGDWLTVEIPVGLIGLEPGFGIDDAYAKTAVSVTHPAGGRATPYYTDGMQNWIWPACWVAEAEEPAIVPPGIEAPNGAPGPGLAMLAVLLSGAVLVHRRR